MMNTLVKEQKLNYQLQISTFKPSTMSLQSSTPPSAGFPCDRLSSCSTRFFHFNKPIFLLSINVPAQLVLLQAASINISPRALHLSSQRALAASHNPPPPHAVNPLEKVQADHACIPLRFDPVFGRLPPNHVMPTDKIYPARLIFVPRQWDPCAFSLITCTAAACLQRQLGTNPPAHPSPDPCIRTPVNPLFADTHSLCFLNAAPHPPPSHRAPSPLPTSHHRPLPLRWVPVGGPHP